MMRKLLSTILLSLLLSGVVAPFLSAQTPVGSKAVVYLQAPPTGESLTWGADRKQFGDLLSDFSVLCPVSIANSDPRVTQPDLSKLGLGGQKKADFIVVMSRFDSKWKRHTRIQVFDGAGAIISDKDSLNMKDQAKLACSVIMQRWNHTSAQSPSN